MATRKKTQPKKKLKKPAPKKTTKPAPKKATKPAPRKVKKPAPKKSPTKKLAAPKPATPVAFDEAETQQVPVAEVVGDIEVQLSLDLIRED